MKVFISSLVIVSALTACFPRESLSEVNRDTPIKVAIIDTGLDLNDVRFKQLCKTGHENFTAEPSTHHVDSMDTTDVQGHGTHVAGLIQKYAGFNTDYCLLIYKFYSNSASGKENLLNEASAIRQAVREGASIINISAGGAESSEEEYAAIKNNPNVTFVVAAGNQGKNIDDPKNKFYPASYALKNEIIVGSVDSRWVRSPTSNYGSVVTDWEVGVGVLSYLNGPNLMGRLSGTSMATAIKTGKIVAARIFLCHSKNNKRKH